MAALQTGAPRQLNVKQEIRVEHPQVIEHWLHAFLADVRVHGEWFKVDHVELPALVTQAMRDLQQMESATPALKTPVSFVRPFGRQRRVTIRISRAMAEQLQVVMEARHQAQQLSSISVLCREALEHYLTCHTFQTTSLPEQGD